MSGGGTAKDYIDIALDKGFENVSKPFLKQIGVLMRSSKSQMQERLNLLEVAADKLEADDALMTMDNAELALALESYEENMQSVTNIIRANAATVEASGAEIAEPSVTARVFHKTTNDIIAAGGNPIASLDIYKDLIDKKNINFRFPVTAQATSQYVDSAAWAAKMEGWGVGYSDLTKQTIKQGIDNGWGPKFIAQKLRAHVENMPVHAAENLMRTLQVTAYRDASVMMEEVNGGFIEKKIRIAKLDNKTCLACVALHGTELEPGERVDDHHRGRCSEFYVVPGGPRAPTNMQADSTPGNRKFTEWQTGEEWFDGLSDSRQAQQQSFLRSPAKLKAYQDGMQLSDLIGDRQDDVFGRQVIEESLISALGDKAEDYYVR